MEEKCGASLKSDFFCTGKGGWRVNGRCPLSLGIQIIPVIKTFTAFPEWVCWNSLSMGLYMKVLCSVSDLRHHIHVIPLTEQFLLFPDFIDVDRISSDR